MFTGGSGEDTILRFGYGEEEAKEAILSFKVGDDNLTRVIRISRARRGLIGNNYR